MLNKKNEQDGAKEKQMFNFITIVYLNLLLE